MKIWLKIVFTFVIFPAACAAFGFYLNHMGFFNVEQVEIMIEDSGPATQAQSKPAFRKSVQKLNEKLERLRGQSLWEIELQKISNELAAEKWIKSFHLTRRWPSTLQVTVQSQSLFFVYMNSQGKVWPVMESGDFLDPLNAGESPDLPIAVNSIFEKSFEVRKKAIENLKQIPSQGTFSRQTISEIHYSARDGFSFMLMQNGLQIKMGEDKIRAKSFRISKVLDYLENKKFQARVIDANLSQKVLVRLRKDP